MNYKQAMTHAKLMQTNEPERAEYWVGYQRGMRRARFGERFGTEQDHQIWLNAINAGGESHRQRGEGYRDGLNEHVEYDDLSVSELAAIAGSAKSPAKTDANRKKSNLPPKPGKQPRGHPFKKK